MKIHIVVAVLSAGLVAAAMPASAVTVVSVQGTGQVCKPAVGPMGGYPGV
jgi:hypothetical protein